MNKCFHKFLFSFKLTLMLEEQLVLMRNRLQKLAADYGMPVEDVISSLNPTPTPAQISFYPSFLPSTEPKDSALERRNSKSMKIIEKIGNVFKSEKDLLYTSRLAKTPIEIGSGQEGPLSRNLECIENSLSEMNNISTTILNNIVELMVTGKTFKIRQNFRGLVLQMLNLQELAFFVCHGSDRIEYQDFSSNFITEIMENNPKCEALEKIFRSATQSLHFVDFVDNSDLMKIFEIPGGQIERGSYFGVTLNCTADEEDESFEVCLMLKSKPVDKSFSMKEEFPAKLLQKIIQISLISTSEESKFVISKTYGKKMLDLLQILIIKTEKSLRSALERENGVNPKTYMSMTSLIKIILSKFEENIVNEQLIKMIRTMASNFQESQYKMVEQIRMYKKYVRQTDLTFLQFQNTGALVFISGNRDIPVLNFLKQLWEPGKPIMNNLFMDNQKLNSHIKRTLRGSLKSERTFEIERDIRARICMNNRKIEKIHILIDNGDESNPSDSLKEDTVKNIKRDKGNPSMVTIKQLEKENPGITKQGWLELFINKNSPMRSDKSQGKRNNTYLKQGTGDMEVFSPLKRDNRQKLTYSHSTSSSFFGIEGIDFQNPNINVLNLNDSELDEFAFNLLNHLDYFQCLHKEKKSIKNFIVDLHDHYEIHSNPFHNFQHGVNVMHTCYLLATLPSNFNIFTEKDIFAIVFSGLCHDVGHTGFTNAFEIASHSKKALTYNDRSPLENYHASLTFELLRKEENNFMREVEREDFIKFRQAIIENILFTDIKEHFPLLKRFSDLVASGKTIGRDDASLISNIIVHSSDFAGSIKVFDVCKEWSYRVNTEFANQYKVEGQLGLPQTPFMKDLKNPTVLSKAESGFLKVIVYPLYQTLDKFYLTEGLVHKFKKNIEENIKEWDQIHKAELEKQEVEG